MSVRLRAQWILAEIDGKPAILDHGEVILEGGTIHSVGPRCGHAVDEAHDFGHALIAPGFVDLNALADVDCTILRIGGNGSASTAWSRSYAESSRRDVLSLDETVTGARSAFAQLLLSGVTTALPVTSLLAKRWAESRAEFDGIAGLARELGIRLVLGPSFRSAVNVIEPDGSIGQHMREDEGRNGLRQAIEFIEAWHGTTDGLVTGLLVPSTIDTCSDELLIETAAAARVLGIPFRLHCCQSLQEAELIWHRSKRTSIGHLQKLGILSREALLPHAVVLGGPAADLELADADRAALLAAGAVIVHCPLVLARGGRRLDGLSALVDRGARIGMGTDTAPPDMLMNLQAGLLAARLDPTTPIARPTDLLRAATIGGADAIGRPDLGRLAPGAAADLVVWDLASLDVQPVHDPIDALFLMPPGRRARHVWIAGRQVVRDSRVIGLDEAAAAAAMASIFARLRAAFAERHPTGLPWPTMFPPAIPIATTTTSNHVQ